MNKISSTEKLDLGMCFGVALGTIFASLAIGLALGAACGVFWGASENKEKKWVFSMLYSMLIFVACYKQIFFIRFICKILKERDVLTW